MLAAECRSVLAAARGQRTTESLLARCLERKMLRGRWGVPVLRRVAARPDRRDRSSRGRHHANLAGLRAEHAAMIDRMAGLVLPLMHHLVQQRMQGLVPSVTSNVTSTHDDLGWFTGGRR